MPNIFKALASIGAWVLFIMGLLGFLFGWIVFIMKMGAGPLDVTKMQAWCSVDTSFILGAIMVTLSACVMILRKKME